jgi:hypothetical protein
MVDVNSGGRRFTYFKTDTILLSNNDTASNFKVIKRSVNFTAPPKSVFGFYATYINGEKYAKTKDTLADLSNPNYSIFKHNVFYTKLIIDNANIAGQDTSYNHCLLFRKFDKYARYTPNKSRFQFPTAFDETNSQNGKTRIHINSSITVKSVIMTDIIENKSIEKNIVNIYPNPSHQKAFVRFEVGSKSDVSLQVSNTLGQVIDNQNINNVISGINTFELNTSSYQHGIYFLTLKVGENSYIQKFIVE